MISRIPRPTFGILLLLFGIGFGRSGPPATGPETEKRFPPLQIPAGFKATLFACDPFVEYLSAVARGPRTGAIFVAADYLTGLGTGTARRDEIHRIEDIDADGYADKKTVFAAGFNSIQGLAFDGETLFVMHAPFLTAVRDANGDGVADERRDLLKGLGLSPEEDQIRLHNANGVTVGHDGWLYLALGDHGCRITRPEGDQLVLEGGGILRCRPDGRDLHVFSKGLRNIYDVALDEELNVFARDNENDGGDYKIRVYHSFFAADHGYPYRYAERPEETMQPLADLGLGSSAGGLCYLEKQFPPEYRGDLFFCEWGRSVVHYRRQRRGSTFAPMKELVFAAGGANDAYGFKPTDMIVQKDGSLIVVDWADDQRPKRGRGRIYRIQHVAVQRRTELIPFHSDSIAQLDSESYLARTEAQAAIERRGRDGAAAAIQALKKRTLEVRGRLHAVWIIARQGGPAAVDDLFDIIRDDRDPRVQAQAVRALADLTDPVLVQHRLDTGVGDSRIAVRLAGLARDKDARVVLEIIIALGRLRWPDAPEWLAKIIANTDAAIEHAAVQTLRKSGNWQAILMLLDQPGDNPIRALAMRAVAELAEPELVEGLLARVGKESDAHRRGQYADLLSRVYKKSGPWRYWGFRPAPRPPNSVAWEKTAAIEQSLNLRLLDPDRSIRLAVLRRMQREAIPTEIEKLAEWLAVERQGERVGAILKALTGRPAEKVRDRLRDVVLEPAHSNENRLAALAMLAKGLPDSGENSAYSMGRRLEEGPVLAEVIRLVGKPPNPEAAEWLHGQLASAAAEVRVAALETLAIPGSLKAAEKIPDLLRDRDPRVRRAAALAAAKMGLGETAPTLLNLAADADPSVRQAGLEALRQLRELKALPLALTAIKHRETEAVALKYLGDLGSPDHAEFLAEVARKNPAADISLDVIRVLTAWMDRKETSPPQRSNLNRTIAEIQGANGHLLAWQGWGPLSSERAEAIKSQVFQTSASENHPFSSAAGVLIAAGVQAPVKFGPSKDVAADSQWLAFTDIMTAEPMAVQLMASSTGSLHFWLNGRPVDAGGKNPGKVRWEADFQKGSNRLLVGITSPKAKVEFQVSFRHKSSKAECERLAQLALTRRGDAARGRKVFFDSEKSLCLKCHRLGDQGEKIGPELTGLGNRFARVHIVESILEPSRTIAPGFQTIAVALKDGRVLTGVKMAETAETLTLGDNQGQKHTFPKSAIDEQRTQPLSTMPDGVENRLTADEFVDLIEFLASQKGEARIGRSP